MSDKRQDKIPEYAYHREREWIGGWSVINKRGDRVALTCDKMSAFVIARLLNADLEKGGHENLLGIAHNMKPSERIKEIRVRQADEYIKSVEDGHNRLHPPRFSNFVRGRYMLEDWTLMEAILEYLDEAAQLAVK